jgi:nicotinamidase-related amidase
VSALTEPVGPKAVRLCIDMQRLFAERTVWQTPTLADIEPNIARIVEAKPGGMIFARFTVPENAPDRIVTSSK